MTLGYALLGALILLLPGFAGYYAARSVEAADLVKPVPDRPNSNFTIFIVVYLALISHAAGLAFFVANEWLSKSVALIELPFDPNPYRILWTGHPPDRPPSAALLCDLVYFSALPIAAWALMTYLAKRDPITTSTAPLRFGWLLPIARQVESGSHVVLGYVLTTTGHEGSWLAYQGIVRRLALDDDDAIEMIVLEQCDRFVGRIVEGRVERVDSDLRTIELIQLRNAQVEDRRAMGSP